MRPLKLSLALIGLLPWFFQQGNAWERPVSFATGDDRVVVHVDGQPIATYAFRDEEILRPHFANVRTMSGVQVTRNHPPQPSDSDDHATMHPGIWMAFGELGGQDFWRHRGRVEHVKFLKPPVSEGELGSFLEQKRYRADDGSVVCEETFHFTIRIGTDAYLMEFDSTFSAPEPFDLGDQEEMGLGIRMATPISEVNGGRLLDATGRIGASQIWSEAADWCDYSGRVEGKWVGAALFCHPSNFRESWFHARDYGLLVANPFGRAAMRKGETSRVTVRPGESLRLRYAVYIHGDADAKELEAAYQAYAQRPTE